VAVAGPEPPEAEPPEDEPPEDEPPEAEPDDAGPPEDEPPEAAGEPDVEPVRFALAPVEPAGVGEDEPSHPASSNRTTVAAAPATVRAILPRESLGTALACTVRLEFQPARP
jgi:hypothetical protein